MIREKICNIEWTISKTDVKKIPQQINGYDCGVINLTSIIVLASLIYFITGIYLYLFSVRVARS